MVQTVLPTRKRTLSPNRGRTPLLIKERTPSPIKERNLSPENWLPKTRLPKRTIRLALLNRPMAVPRIVKYLEEFHDKRNENRVE